MLPKSGVPKWWTQLDYQIYPSFVLADIAIAGKAREQDRQWWRIIYNLPQSGLGAGPGYELRGAGGHAAAAARLPAALRRGRGGAAGGRGEVPHLRAAAVLLRAAHVLCGHQAPAPDNMMTSR